jgi:hypothetical protein
MGNNNGSAMVLVVMILGVVSLIGVGLMSMSRLDIKFSAAIRNYDKMFNLADGANALAVKDLKTMNRQEQANFVGASTRKQTPWASVETSPPNTPVAPTDNIYSANLTGYGGYYTSLILEGYSTEALPGWEAGTRGYQHVFWIGEGRGIVSKNQSIIEAPTQKTEPKY